VRPVAQPRNEGVDMNPKKSFAHQKAQAMIRSHHRNPKKNSFYEKSVSLFTQRMQ
jgi:hypothetical protein